MAQQFNDPRCRQTDDPAHRCTDKYGAWFESPLRPARPGSTCWTETLRRIEDERAAEDAALRHLAESATLDDLAAPYETRPSDEEQAYVEWADHQDVDWRESEEVR